MERISHNGQRFYEVDTGFGVQYLPSVTTVLSVIRKPFLETWRGSVSNEMADLYLESQAERGSRIHEGMETLLKDGVILFNPRTKPNFTQKEIDLVYKPKYKAVAILESSEEVYTCLKIKQFLNIVQPKVLFTEKQIFSTDIRSSGTLDGLISIKNGSYKINGRNPLELEEGNYIIDLKSGNSISEEYHLQVAAYAKCALDMNLVEDIRGGLILHTSSANKSGIVGFGVKLRNKKELLEDLDIYRHALSLWEWKNNTTKPVIYTVPTIIK